MVTPELIAAIRPEWEAARADAGFAEADVRLYPFPGAQSADGSHAYYFVPGQDLVQSEKFPDELGGQLQDANEHRDSHRIAIWVEAPTVALGAKLRHELEHARQFAAHGKPLFNLNDLVLATLAERVGGLPGGGVLYNLNPMEVDANAASARFAWVRYGEDVCREHCAENSEYGALFRSLTPAAPLESLPLRMLTFLFEFADLTELVATRNNRAFVDVLDEQWPGAALTWASLQALELGPPPPAGNDGAQSAE
jgi:hypothetical protein